MIDTHCHLLPGVDDGPATELDSIELARRLREQGVRRIVCTPHVSRRHQPAVAEVRMRLEQLARSLRVLEIDVHLAAAGELTGGFALASDATMLRPWRIGERYVLVEVARDVKPSFFEAVADALDRVGLAPVFAHPERSLLVRRDPRLLDAVRAGGALVQVVAPSLAAAPGSDVYRTAWAMLERGSADIVASDAHRAVGALRLGSVLNQIDERFGAEALEHLTADVPQRVLGEDR